MGRIEEIFAAYGEPRWEGDSMLARLQAARVDPVAIDRWGVQGLGEAEHEEYARSQVAENPFRAIGLLGMIPGYDAAKGMGIFPESYYSIKPGLGSMAAGYRGMWRGLLGE